MNMRTKTFFVITAIFLVAFFVMAIILGNFIKNGYAREESQVAFEKAILARSLLDQTIENLSYTTLNWAEKESTSRFMIDHETQIIEQTLGDKVFNNLQINFCAIIDAEANIIYSKAFNLTDETEVPLPGDIGSLLSNESLPAELNRNSVSGIIPLEYAPMILIMHPINIQQNGSMSGVIFFGRYLDRFALSRLAGAEYLNPEIFEIARTGLNPDVEEVIPSLNRETGTGVRAVDANNIAGYSLLNDITGAPSLILKTSNPRVFYSQAVKEVNYYFAAILAFGLFFILVVLLVLERMVISRISNLSTRVNELGQEGDFSSRINMTGNDEVVSLAGNINLMLNKLHQSRQKQQESETFNSVLLYDAPNPIEVMNADGSLKYVNSALERITGYSKVQLIGRKPPFPWWNNENIQQYMLDLQECAERGTQNVEKQFRNIKGESFWVNINSTAIKKDGEILFYIANWVNITERIKADEATRESEKRFRELAELLPELVFETDLEGKLLFVNRVAFTNFGYTFHDGGALYLNNLVASEDRLRAAEDIQKIIKGDDPPNFEYTAIRKDNRKFPCFIHATQVKNPRGEITGLRGILVDITSQKEIEAELRKSEEFSTSLLNNAPHPIIVANTDSSVRYINPSFENLTGFSSAEIIGTVLPRPWWLEENITQYTNEFVNREAINQQGLERCYRNKNGDRFWVKVSVSPILEKGNMQYYISNWVDITAQKKASQEMEELYQREVALREALQAEIRSRTEFTRALVHELKTPLTPIMASSELLVEELNEEPLTGLARNVFRGAQNMNKRVDELLDLARGEVGMLKVKLNPVDPEKLLYEVHKYMEPSAQHSGQTLSLVIQSKLPVVMADDDRVRQILFNLIGNSIKYSPPGSHIEVSAREEEDNLVFDVKDTGRGMSEEEQEKLFQPYYRIEGRERLSGLGLGLALSKKLVELQNGRIWVVSHKGKGSTFSFSLPIKNIIQMGKTLKSGGVK